MTKLEPVAEPTVNPCQCGYDRCYTCSHWKAWWAIYHSEHALRQAKENDPEVTHGWAGLS
jgi:hypothetical protein